MSCGPMIVLAALFCGNAQAQIHVNDSISIHALVNDVLLGGNLTATNITYNGVAADAIETYQAGSFTSTDSPFSIAEGVVMGSGGVRHLNPGQLFTPTDNFQNDPDLMVLSGHNMNDCSIIEFDFVAESDTFLIDYIFASREYPAFTCSSFNDVFGLFISGAGIQGPFTNDAINIALIPNSDTPVGVNTVNSGFPSAGNPANCLEANPNFVNDSVYFINNNPPLPNSINVPGHTHLLTASASLQAGMTYHVKLAIGDAVDTALDSFVLFRKGGVAQEDNLNDLEINVSTSGIQVAPEGIHIAGTFNFFVPEPMDLVRSDVYTFIARVRPSVNVVYKFYNGSSLDAPELSPEDCGIVSSMPGFSRHLVMPAENVELDPVCFGTCEVCMGSLSANESQDANLLEIFPNPASDHFQLLPPADGQANIRVFDISGRNIMQKQLNLNAGNPVTLELVNQTKGLYFVQLQYDQHTEMQYVAKLVLR